MPAPLASSVWPPISVGIAVLAISVSVYLSWRQRERRALRCGVSAIPLVSIDPTARERVEIRYDGTPVRQPHLVRVDVENTGNRAIVAEDFEHSLSVTFPAGELLAGAQEVVLTDPDTLEPQLELDGAVRRVGITPLLLNPGDRFTFTVLIDGPATDPEVSARIRGIKRVTRAAGSGGANRTVVQVGGSLVEAISGTPARLSRRHVARTRTDASEQRPR